MGISVIYKTSDGKEFDNISAACNHEYDKQTHDTIYLDKEGNKQDKYCDETMIAIFFDAESFKSFKEKDYDNSYSQDVPPPNEAEDFIDDIGFFAIYWNEWLEQWEFYDFDEITKNYKKCCIIHEQLKELNYVKHEEK